MSRHSGAGFPDGNKAAASACSDLRSDSGADLVLHDHDLYIVVNAWPYLPTALRSGIVAMVDAAHPRGQGT
jgi:hypothetical protein